jgi:ubiquinone/menaquinone biosynthesis C-methylase UbiE
VSERPLAAEAARAADLYGNDRVYPDGSFMFVCHLWGYLDFAARCAPGARVLDLACGEGYGAAVLADAGHHVVGLDLEPPLLRDAAGRYPGPHFTAGSALVLPFGDDSFDAVGALQVIEHLTQTSEFVSEIARVLKPDGFAYLTTPNIDRLPRNATKEFNPFHLRDFTPAELRAELDAVFGDVALYGQVMDETLPRTQRLLEQAQREWALVDTVDRIEAFVRRLPGPLRVRLRRTMLRLRGIPIWPLPEAEAARAAIRAEDFTAAEPAEASGCTVAICRVPRR